ncbi:transglycosylase SLT domain-containing protein [bacterium]|nr:transglycosylase SLT domain-containing protein [bacterium]
MTKINPNDVKLNAVNSVGTTKANKTQENQKTNSDYKLQTTNENELVGLSVEDEKAGKNFFEIMSDLLSEFFKKIFGGEKAEAKPNGEPTTKDEIPQIDDDLAKSVDEKLGDGFSDKAEEVANNINCDPTDLLTVLYSESSLNPEAENSSGAYGIMQFMPSTLEDLGYTTDEVKNMSATEQLDIVQKYFEKNNYYHKGEKLTAAQLYAMVLAPGRAGGDTLYTQGKDGQAYVQNEGLDIDDNGKIAMGDLDKRMQNKNSEMQQVFVV